MRTSRRDSELLQDLNTSFRNLSRNPGFTAVAILTLALGIGANTAIFSIVENVLLRPLPFAHGEQLVHLGYRPPSSGDEPVEFSVLETQDYRRDATTLTGLTEYHQMDFSLLGRGEPEQVKVGVVSGNFFDELGVRPLLGRGLQAQDELHSAPPVILLTYDYWQHKMGGDPRVLGAVMRMNNRPITVVGVLPPLPQFPGDDDVFISLNACPFRSSERAQTHREIRMAELFARVRPGVSLEQVQANVTTIAKRLHQEYPAAYRRSPDAAVPVVRVRDQLTQNFRPTVLALLAAVGLVLLLACANLANLTMARLFSRQREIVVRAALGAGRGRIIRQLLTESTLVAVAGGVLGLLLARACLSLLVAFAGRFTPRASEVHIDGWVLLFTLAVAVLTGLAFGTLPALQATRHRLSDALREGGARSTVGAAGNRARALLVVAQVAISFVLLTGAGLTLRSLLKLQGVQPGVKSANVLTAKIQLPFSKYPELENGLAFFTRLLEQLEARPGVVAAALANDNPLEGDLQNPTIAIEGQPVAAGEAQPKAAYHSVSNSYFRLLSIPLRDGRLFQAGDTDKAPLVAIVNESLARHFFPSRNPLGQKIALTSWGSGKYRTIVGVVADVKQHGLTADAGPGFYFPMAQAPRAEGTLLIGTAGDPTRMIGDLRAAVRALDPEQPLDKIQTLEQAHSDALAPSRLTTTLLLLFAILAFVITVTGVSGVIAFFVSERRQEIGVRSALGAHQGNILWLVLRQGVGLVAIGLVAGGAVALGLGRLFASLLFGIEPTDPPTFVLVALALLAVVSLACLLPARRATQIDPVIALRG